MIKIKHICKNRYNAVRPGFTMIEALVSLSIIFVLINVFLANYRVGNQKADLDMAAQKLASDINLVRTYALGLKEHNGSFPPGGWGIRFLQESDTYKLITKETNNYTVINDLNTYKENEIPQQNTRILGKINLNCGANSVDRNHGFIFFAPPEPKVRLQGSNSPNNFNPANPNTQDCEVITITLEVLNTGFTRDIVVNKFGMVEIK